MTADLNGRRVIDISVPVDLTTPVWPDSPGARIWRRMKLEDGAHANVSQLEMDVHTGTHVDAPLHFVAGGASVTDMGLDPFVGPAWVADTGESIEIGASVLDALAVPDRVERLLLKTSNSRDPRYRTSPFREDYAALTLDGAQWAARRPLKLIGIDYLSIQRFHDDSATHKVLLDAGICILEGLDLRLAQTGMHELLCLPLRLAGVEAAPARALLLG